MRNVPRLFVFAFFAALCLPPSKAYGFSLWSTSESYLGAGKFYGPGAVMDDQDLFEIELHNLAFFTNFDFVTPFMNNGEKEPNICAEKALKKNKADGRLSDGTLINENADICLMVIAGVPLLPAVIAGGPHNGQQINITGQDGNIVMTMDLALDMGIGKKGVVRLPFYGTTGRVTVPASLQTQQGGHGADQAGKLKSGTVIEGRIGDFNHDGWIDGTMVAAGNMPLDSPIFPGLPYVLYRNFETNLPIEGHLFGNIKELSVKDVSTR
jgi:hypothetical protein